MQVSVVEAKNQLSQLIRAVEQGEVVTITRNGHPVAELGQPRERKGKIELGGMRRTIRLMPGWDDSVDPDEFLAGRL